MIARYMIRFGLLGILFLASLATASAQQMTDCGVQADIPELECRAPGGIVAHSVQEPEQG